MLYALLDAGGDTYAIDTAEIEAVIPCVAVKKIPAASLAISGIANFHGDPLVIVDCGVLLTGIPSPLLYSTRILVCNIHVSGFFRKIGLLAENATRVQRLLEGEFVSPGAHSETATFAREVANVEGRWVQRLRPDSILTVDVIDALTSGEGGID